MEQDKTLPGADISGLRIDRDAREPTRSSRAIWIVAAIGTVVVLLVLAVVILRGGQKVEVEVALARSLSGGAADAVLNASGYVTPRRKATVAAKITGQVKEILVEEGMRVQAGQVLARLDDSEYKAGLDVAVAEREVAVRSVAEAEANAAEAERTVWRTRELKDKGFSTQEDLDRALTNLDVAKARLALARKTVEAAERRIEVAQRNLDNCTVRAPFDGIAVSKDAQPGEIVSPVSAGGGFTRTGISTIVDMESLEIEVDVNESYIARVQPGQPVEATLDAYPDWRIPAKVRTTIPTADRQKATVKVRISFDKLDPRILPDMGIKVAFLRTAEEATSTGAQRVLVPKEALRDEAGQKIVFVVRDEKLERRAVATGLAMGSDIEVVAGIGAGDAVVIKGPEELKDGQRAIIRK
ncbi:MAG: efflux RND transporter periplasmic adaptor subunit [Acidobacteriota bacterium]